MPRIPYLPENLAEPADLVERIRARRGGALLELDRILLYSPALAEGWNHMLGNVRTRLSVAAKLRELAMCVVAVVNRAQYEFVHHAPLFVEAGGSAAQVDALRVPDAARADQALFDPLERATIALSIEMTRDVTVSDTTFDVLRTLLPPQEIVELVGTVAAYNMVSRFLVAFDVQPPASHAGAPPAGDALNRR